MQSNEITEPLTPLIQVASLLQARKETDKDVQVILEICSTLSTAQVIKVKNVEKIENFRRKKISKSERSIVSGHKTDKFNEYCFYFQILKSYTLDDCEAPIKPAFIGKLTKKLNERPIKVRIEMSFEMFRKRKVFEIFEHFLTFSIVVDDFLVVFNRFILRLEAFFEISHFISSRLQLTPSQWMRRLCIH